jgi:hypothetical protein
VQFWLVSIKAMTRTGVLGSPYAPMAYEPSGEEAASGYMTWASSLRDGGLTSGPPAQVAVTHKG